MEDKELKLMWNSCHEKMNQADMLNLQSWAVNIKTFEYLQKHRAQSKLTGLAKFKKTAIVLGFIWVVLLGVLVWGNQLENMFFTISLCMIMLFTTVAMAVYIKHIMLINKINYTEKIVEAQQKLTRLQISTLSVLRILWLQLPFYTTFFWSNAWMKQGYSFWITAFPITLVSVFAAAWLYKNIRLKNAEKKRFRALLGKEWNSVVYAKEYLEELEDFTNNR